MLQKRGKAAGTGEGLSARASGHMDRVFVQRTERDLTNKLVHNDEEQTSTPPAKRTRERPNGKNIPKETWDYVDWMIRKYEEEGYDWEVWVNDEFVKPRKVRKRTKEEVPLTIQNRRNHALTRGPAPRQPPKCLVLQKPLVSSMPDSTGSTTPPGKSECNLPKSIDTESSPDGSDWDNPPLAPDYKSYNEALFKALQCKPVPERQTSGWIRTRSGESDVSNLSWNPCNSLFQSEHSPVLITDFLLEPGAISLRHRIAQ